LSTWSKTKEEKRQKERKKKSYEKKGRTMKEPMPTGKALLGGTSREGPEREHLVRQRAGGGLARPGSERKMRDF